MMEGREREGIEEGEKKEENKHTDWSTYLVELFVCLLFFV